MGQEIVVIQIPAFNEEENISNTINECIKVMQKLEYEYKIIIIDDGSTDGTLTECLKFKDIIIYQLKQNKGLAYAFQFGIDEALKLGATVIVNLDADGQYPVIKIPKLIEPIINKECDVVIGDRKVREVLEFLEKISSITWNLCSE